MKCRCTESTYGAVTFYKGKIYDYVTSTQPPGFSGSKTSGFIQVTDNFGYQCHYSIISFNRLFVDITEDRDKKLKQILDEV